MLNDAFQTRVASVPGGLELLLAAGFKLSDDPSDGTCLHPAHSLSVVSVSSDVLGLVLLLLHGL